MKTSDLAHIAKKKNTLLVVNTLLALILTIAVLFLVRDVASVAFTSKAKATLPQEKAPVGLRHSLMDYSGILRNNPFGLPAAELTPLSPAGKSQSASPADEALIGTVAGRRELSYAIFADKTGKQQIFRAGEEVFGLGILDKVEKDRVLIDSHGRKTEIPLKDIVTVKDITRNYPPIKPSGSFGIKTGPASYVVDQRKVLQAINKPDQLMTDARFVPNIVGGVQQGFVLREVKPGGIYSSLGLRNGDVLLRINQFSISNPEAALQAFNALKGIDRAQLDIIRNGSKMTLTYQIR